MRSGLLTLFLLSFFSSAKTQELADTLAQYFTELRAATAAHAGLWKKDLYAPVLLVNKESREVFASEGDSAGSLQWNGKIFSGRLPAQVNISNTSIHWNGTHWAMVMLPLPVNKKARINLLTHELFHRAQKALGFNNDSPDNPHLEEKDGRTYLRLEMEALKKALKSNASQGKQHLLNALRFRLARHQLYGGARSTENKLELNEGLCEYTGVQHSGRTDAALRKHFLRRIESFLVSPSYMRSFAYEALPVYGYFLHSKHPGWQLQLTQGTDLTEYFCKAFSLADTVNPQRAVKKIEASYNALAIKREEEKREASINKRKAFYHQLFFDSPVLELPLVKMNMAFDYTRIFPLNESGTVYPDIRLTDQWGILTVKKASLISSNWKSIKVTAPTEIQTRFVKGDGWELALNEGYSVEKVTGGNYILKQNKAW